MTAFDLIQSTRLHLYCVSGSVTETSIDMNEQCRSLDEKNVVL